MSSQIFLAGIVCIFISIFLFVGPINFIFNIMGGMDKDDYEKMTPKLLKSKISKSIASVILAIGIGLLLIGLFSA